MGEEETNDEGNRPDATADAVEEQVVGDTHVQEADVHEADDQEADVKGADDQADVEGADADDVVIFAGRAGRNREQEISSGESSERVNGLFPGSVGRMRRRFIISALRRGQRA